MNRYLILISSLCIFTASAHEALNEKKQSSTLHDDQPITTTLSLPQAIEQAYRHKPNLQQYKYLIQASRIDEKAAWTGYYPSAILTSGLSTESAVSNLHSSVGLNVNQLIYNFAGPQELSKKATRNTTLLCFQEEAQKNDLRLAVEIAFLEGWRQQQQKKSIHALSTASKATFAVAQHENRLQLLDKNDWLKAGETHTADMATVFNYQDDLQIAQKNLEFLLGYSVHLNFKQPDRANTEKPTTALLWQEREPHALNPLTHYEESALTHRPEIKAKQKQVEIEEVNITLARNSRLPTFGLSAMVNYDNVGSTNTTTNALSVGMTFPIFDQLVSDYAGDRAQAQKMAAILDKQETIQEIKRDVALSYHQLSQALTSLKAEKFRYQRAENEYQLNRLQYNIGNITESALKTATHTWETEKIVWINQRIDVEKKWCQLMHDCGYGD